MFIISYCNVVNLNLDKGIFLLTLMLFYYYMQVNHVMHWIDLDSCIPALY